MNEQNKYIPGTCNIGRAEIEQRKRGGWFGLIAAIILFVFMIYTNSPRIWRIIIFFPATFSALGFLQARMHFCAYFGSVGVFNFNEAGKRETVMQKEFREKDKRKAREIILYSIIIGAIAAAAAYYAPV